MSRLPFIGVLLSVALLIGPAQAQTKAATQGTVEHVLVRDQGDNVEVEIQTSGTAVSPNTQAITGPDRIVVDFPGMLPASTLRAIQANRGALKSVRSGLFFNNPPITRIVLDLSAPQAYHISTIENAIVVKLGPAQSTDRQVATAGHGAEHAAAEHHAAELAAEHHAAERRAPEARLQEATMTSGPKSAAPQLSVVSAPVGTVSRTAVPQVTNANLESSTVAPAAAVPPPPQPTVSVTYENGLLRIHAERVTLAQVLFEVHIRTKAEIAIPAGAEQEKVIADLGPAPARDVLGALLNGSPYNFIFVGDELSLERVILTRRDSTNF